jgi:hypothetical protein
LGAKPFGMNWFVTEKIFISRLPQRRIGKTYFVKMIFLARLAALREKIDF